MQPRFRLFAGPNGSGKTTLFENLRKDGIIHTEIYVNADKIEAEIKANKKFHFNAYRIKVTDAGFKEHIINSGLFTSKLSDTSFINHLIINKGILHIGIPKAKINSYHASFIATYLADKLIASDQSFCFETVMSHPSKIDFLRQAKAAGYRTYLYFLFTENVQVNIARVQLRAKQGLHNVSPELISSRYLRTFKNLPAALKEADVAYIIDSSTTDIKIVAEKSHGKVIIKGPLASVIKPYLK